MKVRAPAKVNLQLRILGRRADGFHDIETSSCRFRFPMKLPLNLSGRYSPLTCDDLALPIDRSNLAAAAAYEFQEETGLRFAATIHLRKRIPIAGFGGRGSSDAAAVLLTLDELLDTKLGSKTCRRLRQNRFRCPILRASSTGNLLVVGKSSSQSKFLKT